MIINFLFFVITIGLIVLVHELGHLIVAKRNGVHCHTFSIGMGPAIKHLYTDKSGTTYFLRAIPLGGFVVLAGEETGNEADIDVPDDQKIDSKGKWVRFKIFFAGSFMNVIFCVVLLSITAFFGGIAQTDTSVITVAENSNMQAAGFETGDEIVSVNGEEVDTYEEITMVISDVDTATFTTSTGEEITVTANEEGIYGISPYMDKFEFIPSIIDGVVSTVVLIFSIILSLILMLTPAAGIEDLSGPVGIFSVGEEIVSLGWVAAINWIAYLSVNIGFINLLPIPITDGGRIMFIIFEVIFKRKPNKKTEDNLIIGSAIVLLGIFVFVTFNDIVRLIGG